MIFAFVRCSIARPRTLNLVIVKIERMRSPRGVVVNLVIVKIM